jgi:plastocyanin
MAQSVGRASPATAPEPPIPRLQRLLESIPALLIVGLVMPTLLYTVWSVGELMLLPRFDASTAGSAVAGHGHGLPAVGAGVTGASGVTAGTAVAADAVRVSMRSMAYAPRELEISAGTTVTWTNDDPIDHAVAHGTPDTPASERLFASGDFAGGNSFSHTFTEPGTYPVYCSTIGHYQAGMTMTVVVKEGP